MMYGGLAVLAADASVAQSRAVAAPPRMGLIGLGNRSRRHFSALELLGNVEVVALCDLESDRLRSARQGPAAGAELYTDYRELLADDRVQAVTIAVPNSLHAEMAIAALRRGKDVLLEKPIAVTYEEALQVEAAARETGRVLAVGMQRHYDPALSRIVAEVRAGVVGTPYLFALNEYRGDWNPATWRWTDPGSGEQVPWRHRRSLAGSSLLEFSVHSYGFLYEMIRTPLTYCAATGGAVHWPDRTTEDNLAVIAEFGPIRVQHTYSGSAPGADWHISAIGSKGSLQYNRRDRTVEILGEHGRDLVLESRGADPASTEAAMYEDFFQAIREGTEPVLNARFAIEATKLAYAAWISIDERRVVTEADFA